MQLQSSMASMHIEQTFVQQSSAVAEMGDRLATTDMGRKVGGCCGPILQGAQSWVPI